MFRLNGKEYLMYISKTVLRIILAVALGVLLLFNFSISHNRDIPEKTQRKIGNVSAIIYILMIVLASCVGIIDSE